MNNPVLIAVPVLMLLDYTLTILGARASAGVYRQHFNFPYYELNPLWRKTVERMRWFSLPHLIVVSVLTSVLVLLDRMSSFQAESFQLLLAMLLGCYGFLCGRHLTNFLLFQFLNRNPSEISGQVEMTQRLVLKISLFNLIGLVPLLGLLVVLIPEVYAIGVLLGVLALGFVHLIW